MVVWQFTLKEATHYTFRTFRKSTGT